MATTIVRVSDADITSVLQTYFSERRRCALPECEVVFAPVQATQRFCCARHRWRAHGRAVRLTPARMDQIADLARAAFRAELEAVYGTTRSREVGSPPVPTKQSISVPARVRFMGKRGPLRGLT